MLICTIELAFIGELEGGSRTALWDWGTRYWAQTQISRWKINEKPPPPFSILIEHIAVFWSITCFRIFQRPGLLPRERRFVKYTKGYLSLHSRVHVLCIGSACRGHLLRPPHMSETNSSTIQSDVRLRHDLGRERHWAYKHCTNMYRPNAHIYLFAESGYRVGSLPRMSPSLGLSRRANVEILVCWNWWYLRPVVSRVYMARETQGFAHFPVSRSYSQSIIISGVQIA
jgi:hypothetical protein